MSHQKKKDRQNQSTTSERANTNHTPERRITPTITQPTQNPKTKKKNHTTHSRLTNHSTPRLQPTQTHIQSSCSPPISATAHTLNYTLLTTPCPHTACRHCTHHLFYHPSPLYHHPCLHSCPQLYPFLSRSRYRSPSTCAPLPDGRYGPPPPGYHMLTCILLLSHCYLHTVHMSVCTTVLTLLQHPDYRLGFSPCAHHDLSFSPSVCHPGHLRYHQSLTRVHSHSLPVPPPLPLADARSQGGSTVGRSRSLACVTAVRLSLMVPLAGESPLADARLPPHPNGSPVAR